jgi:hypothetical protein
MSHDKGGLRMRAASSCLAAGLMLLAGCAAHRQETRSKEKSEQAAESATQAAQAPPLETVLEPKAIELLKAASRRLAAARSMRFTAVVSYEHPSRLGPALVYTTKSEVTLQRPDKLRVITNADGPPSEFYYDGKTITAFAPSERLVAIADAPDTIDAALKAAFDSAAIYFPFSDVIVADPYADIADGLKRAFYIGQSQIVGGTTTDMVAYANDSVFVQAWIGAKDHLPRMLRAVYRDDPSRLRHQLELSDWHLDIAVPASTFVASHAAGAKRIEFARPDPPLPPDVPPTPQEKPADAR